jgi:hypothetical protein
MFFIYYFFVTLMPYGFRFIRGVSSFLCFIFQLIL